MSSLKNIIVIQQGRDTLEILKNQHVKVLVSHDGIDGIRKIIRHRPDLIIVKAELEHLNGLSMIKILEAFKIIIPTIFTSDSATNQQRAQRFQSTIGFLLEAEIRERLQDTIQEGMASFEWQYFDPVYHFRQHEWADLMGSSERKRLLLVEDSAMVRQFSLSVLDPLDEFELYSAQDGLEGIYKALLTQPDLILSDIEMPGIDGLTMSQIFFIIGKPFPIVFLTAKADDRLVEKARNLEGVIGYIVKRQVREKEEFLRQIRNHLQMAETLQASSAETYREGSLEKLAQTGSGQGILNSAEDWKISGLAHDRFIRKHAKGLGALWREE